MTLRRCLAAFVTVTLASALPAAAAPSPVRPAPSLRASADRAADRHSGLATTDGRVRNNLQAGMGGGGGGGHTAIMLLSLAVSAAGTYFLVKELKKQNEPAAARR
jgi:hypothetical protein